MVTNTGKTTGADTFKPVNAPDEIQIIENAQGGPATIRMERRSLGLSVLDRWRIDDEWWREKPVARMYFEVLLTSGHRLVIYKDLASGRWYRQAY